MSKLVLEIIDKNDLNERHIEELSKFISDSNFNNIFLYPFYLKYRAQNFQYILCRDREQLVCLMPICIADNSIIMPNQIQVLGPVFNKSINFCSKRYYDILNAFLDYIDELKVEYINIRCNYKITNILPFIWHNYKSSVLYTNIIDNLEQIDDYNKFSKKISYDIKKAIRNNYRYKILEDSGFIYEYFKDNVFKFDFIDYETFIKFDKEIDKNRLCVGVYDQDGSILNVIYIVYNRDIAYYLFSAFNRLKGKNTSCTFGLWKAFNILKTKTKIFDFEGSIIPGVAEYFRGFNPVLKPFYSLVKDNRKNRKEEYYGNLLKLLKKWKKLKYEFNEGVFKNKRIAIYGAGVIGKYLYDNFKSNNLICFIEKDKKNYTDIDLPVYSIDEFNKNIYNSVDVILCSILYDIDINLLFKKRVIYLSDLING